MRFYLIPAIVGLALIANYNTLLIGGIFMALFGLSAGAVGVIHGAIWAETYGVTHLGAIKAIGTAFMVFSTALSPPIMGAAIDKGFTIEEISLASAAYMIFAATLVTLVINRVK